MATRWISAFALATGMSAGAVYACAIPGSAGCDCSMASMSTTQLEAIARYNEAQAAAVRGQAIDLPFAFASTVTVNVADSFFDSNPTINVGDTVHWNWTGSFHSVTSVAGSAEAFDSTVFFSPGATFDHTFTHAGTFAYYCSIHGFDNGNGTAGGMSGFVTVLAVPEPASALAGLGLCAGLFRRRSR